MKKFSALAFVPSSRSLPSSLPSLFELTSSSAV
jgi:hypothetical protein